MIFVEAVVVIFVIAILVLMILLAIINPPHDHRAHSYCINNLKQLGLAYRIWEGDNRDKNPMELSVTNGGHNGIARRSGRLENISGDVQ